MSTFRFFVYGSRKARSIPMEVSAEDISEKIRHAIDVDLPTKVLVHGFGSDCDHIWVYEMRSALMQVQDCNVGKRKKKNCNIFLQFFCFLNFTDEKFLIMQNLILLYISLCRLVTRKYNSKLCESSSKYKISGPTIGEISSKFRCAFG